MEVMADTFPGAVTITPEIPAKNGKVSPEELRIGDLGYCPPYLLSSLCESDSGMRPVRRDVFMKN